MLLSNYRISSIVSAFVLLLICSTVGAVVRPLHQPLHNPQLAYMREDVTDALTVAKIAAKEMTAQTQSRARAAWRGYSSRMSQRRRQRRFGNSVKGEETPLLNKHSNWTLYNDGHRLAKPDPKSPVRILTYVDQERRLAVHVVDYSRSFRDMGKAICVLRGKCENLTYKVKDYLSDANQKLNGIVEKHLTFGSSFGAVLLNNLQDKHAGAPELRNMNRYNWLLARPSFVTRSSSPRQWYDDRTAELRIRPDIIANPSAKQTDMAMAQHMVHEIDGGRKAQPNGSRWQWRRLIPRSIRNHFYAIQVAGREFSKKTSPEYIADQHFTEKRFAEQ